MSGMTCSMCGRGDLEGFTWGWFEGRLVHNARGDNGEIGCVVVHGVREGMVECAIGGHVVWPQDVVLAELRITFDRDGVARPGALRPRSTGFQPYVIRVDVVPPDFEVPDDTKAVIVLGPRPDEQYLACRECAGKTWHSESVLTPLVKPRRGGRSSGPRRTTRAATLKAESASEGRQAKVREILAEGATTTDAVAKALAVHPKTAQRELKAVGAVPSGTGVGATWSLPPTEDETE